MRNHGNPKIFDNIQIILRFLREKNQKIQFIGTMVFVFSASYRYMAI